MSKYNVGDKVIYLDMGAEIDSVSHVANHPELILYSLTSLDDSDLTCSALENEGEEYFDEHDNTEALQKAHSESEIIRSTIDSLTDKYYSDGTKIN